MGIITNNFRVENLCVKPSEDDKVLEDKRTGIKCVNPTMDIECYLNYIELLNSLNDRWVSSGYLDWGMCPIWLPPSFLAMEGITAMQFQAYNKLGINVCSLPPVSFIREVCHLTEPDLWAFREDLEGVIKNPELNIITSRDVMRYFLDANN